MARNPFRKSVASATPRRRRRTLLGMEMLEDRRVMATFTVANGLDDGAGSLREAIALANADPAPDTIRFAPSVTAVTLTSGQLTISTDTTIKGPAGGAVTVRRSSDVGTPSFRIFQIEAAAAAELSNLTITGGSPASDIFGSGGGIRAFGNLALNFSTVTGNASPRDGAGIWGIGMLTIHSSDITANTSGEDGGGIFFEGCQLRVTSSTIADNTAEEDGGGIFVRNLGFVGQTQAVIESSTFSGNTAGSSDGGGGGIFAQNARLTVSSSTFSGNTAAVFGGGILAAFIAPLRVTSSTFSGNTAAQGGGISGYVQDDVLINTIVANSTGGDLSTSGSFIGSGNLIEDGSGGASLGKISGDPNLGPLANNGGPTLTHAPLPGSPAIDGGAHVFQVNRLIEDQRGAPRPIGAFDIGAVEIGGTSVSLVVTRADDVTNPSDGLTTLREAVELANSNPDANAITFASGIQTVTLTQGTLGLGSLVTISGPAGGTVTVTRDPAAPDFGIFSVPFEGTAQLANLTVTGARGASAITNYGGLRVTASTIANNSGAAVGGGIYNDGTLIVDASTLSGNSAGVGGGIASGYFEGTATAKVVNSTLSGNTAAGTGGAIHNANTEGTFTVLSSTIAGNSAAVGGGIYAEVFTVQMTLHNSIVADSTSGGDLASPIPDRFSGSGNLVEDGSGGANLVRISGDPKLGPLASNGGPTRTHALLPGSSAINAGVNALAGGLATDQRGFNRFVSTVDIGAVEHQGGIAFLQPDPLNPGQNVLIVLGSSAEDDIEVNRKGRGRYEVEIRSRENGSSQRSKLEATFSGPISRVVVYGGDGNDEIRVDNNLKADAWLYGDAGDDEIVGGGGNDLLLGGTGKDQLKARGGRDILIGGADADDLFAGNSEDLLIAGTTAFDLDEIALNSIQQEWTSGRGFDKRVKNLRGTGTGPRENGNFFLKASGPGATVFDDNAKDDLHGNGGRNWFFANLTGSGKYDKIHGLKKCGVVDELP